MSSPFNLQQPKHCRFDRAKDFTDPQALSLLDLKDKIEALKGSGISDLKEKDRGNIARATPDKPFMNLFGIKM